MTAIPATAVGVSNRAAVVRMANSSQCRTVANVPSRLTELPERRGPACGPCGGGGGPDQTPPPPWQAGLPEPRPRLWRTSPPPAPPEPTSPSQPFTIDGSGGGG